MKDDDAYRTLAAIGCVDLRVECIRKPLIAEYIHNCSAFLWLNPPNSTTKRGLLSFLRERAGIHQLPNGLGAQILEEGYQIAARLREKHRRLDSEKLSVRLVQMTLVTVRKLVERLTPNMSILVKYGYPNVRYRDDGGYIVEISHDWVQQVFKKGIVRLRPGTINLGKIGDRGDYRLLTWSDRHGGLLHTYHYDAELTHEEGTNE